MYIRVAGECVVCVWCTFRGGGVCVCIHVCCGGVCVGCMVCVHVYVCGTQFNIRFSALIIRHYLILLELMF